MTILVHIFTTPRSLIFLTSQAAFWRDHGLQMHVICGDGPELTAFAQQEGITYDVVPFCRKPHVFKDAQSIWQLYWLLKRLRPKIVHVNTPKAAVLGIIAARLAQVPIRVYEIHGLPFETRRGWKRWGLIQLEKLICRLATGVLAVSASLKAVATQHRLTAETSIFVPSFGSCNGVDATHTFNRERLAKDRLKQVAVTLNLSEKIIGFIGRLTRDKGLKELTESWRLLRDQYPQVTLLILGEPEGQSPAEHQFLEQLSADERVRMLGHVSDVPYYLALMNVLILPTYREGFVNVLLEAAAMEVPVVASRVTGVVDAVVDGQTGLLCVPRSAKQIAEAVQRYLDCPPLAQQHGQKARQHVLKHFKPSAIWQAKWAFYQHQLVKKES